MDLSRARSDLIAGGVGVIVLLVAAFAIRLPIILAIVVAIVVYVALRLLIPPPAEVVPGKTKGDVNQIIREGQGRIAQIQTLAGQIPRRDVAAHVQKIAAIASDIYADFQQRP